MTLLRSQQEHEQVPGPRLPTAGLHHNTAPASISVHLNHKNTSNGGKKPRPKRNQPLVGWRRRMELVPPPLWRPFLGACVCECPKQSAALSAPSAMQSWRTSARSWLQHSGTSQPFWRAFSGIPDLKTTKLTRFQLTTHQR